MQSRRTAFEFYEASWFIYKRIGLHFVSSFNLGELQLKDLFTLSFAQNINVGKFQIIVVAKYLTVCPGKLLHCWVASCSLTANKTNSISP